MTERERREKRVKTRMSNAPNVRHAEAQQFLSVFYYIVCVAIALAPERIYMPNTHTQRVPISIWLRKIYSQENSFLMRRQLEKKLLDFIHTQIIIR